MKQAAAVLFFVIFFLSRSTVQAQTIQNCDGRWTNKPCSGKVEEKIAEKSNSPADPALSQKRSALHELNMKAIDAKRSYGLRFDLAEVQDYCLDPSTSLAACRKQVSEGEDRLDKKVSDFAAVKAQERANKLQEEANKLQEKQKTQPETVVIEDNDVIEVIPHRPWHGHDDEHEHGSGNWGGHDPGHRPPGAGPNHGASIGVQVQGEVNGSSVAVSGSTGGTVVSVPNGSWPGRTTVLSDHFSRPGKSK